MQALCSSRFSSVITCEALGQRPASTLAYCPVLASWFRVGLVHWYQPLIQNWHLKCGIINRQLPIMTINTFIFIQSFIWKYILTNITQCILHVISFWQQRTIISIAWLFISLWLPETFLLLTKFARKRLPLTLLFNQVAPFVNCTIDEVLATILL